MTFSDRLKTHSEGLNPESNVDLENPDSEYIFSSKFRFPILNESLMPGRERANGALPSSPSHTRKTKTFRFFFVFFERERAVLSQVAPSGKVIAPE